jgi:hypothetical protein
LVLSRERNDTVKGSLAQGVNVENATYVRSMDQRYSHYIVVIPSAQLTLDSSGGVSNIGTMWLRMINASL